MIGVFWDDVKTVKWRNGTKIGKGIICTQDDHAVSGAAVQVQSSYSEYGKQEALSLFLSPLV